MKTKTRKKLRPVEDSYLELVQKFPLRPIRNEAEYDTRRPAKRAASWHYLHLYKPTAIISESNMPPYPYLFEKRKISGQRSHDALPEDQVQAGDGYEIVPKNEARELVAYLLSLDRSHPLKEVKSEAPAPAAAAPAAPAAPALK